MLVEIGFEPLAQAAHLGAIFIGLVLRQVHPLLCEPGDIAVVNMQPPHVLTPRPPLSKLDMRAMSPM
jgi:hypothetical protein